MKEPPKEPARKKPKRTTAASPEAPKDTRTATIHTTAAKTRARGFTFGKGQVVPAVPLAHAEYLKGAGEAQIIDVQS